MKHDIRIAEKGAVCSMCGAPCKRREGVELFEQKIKEDATSVIEEFGSGALRCVGVTVDCNCEAYFRWLARNREGIEADDRPG